MTTERKIRILILAPSDEERIRLEPFFSRATMELTHVRTAEHALERAARRRFDLMTVTLPLPDMEFDKLIPRIRLFEEGEESSPVIVMAEGNDFEQAQRLEFSSLSAIHTGDSDSVYRHVISDALGVAARLAVRIPIRLEVGIEAGRTFRFCETRNISRSGILISSSRPLPLGSSFRFELTFPYTLAPLSGFAEVVRHTDAGVEGTSGFGAMFLSLSEEDDVRIQSFIQNELDRTARKSES